MKEEITGNFTPSSNWLGLSDEEKRHFIEEIGKSKALYAFEQLQYLFEIELSLRDSIIKAFGLLGDERALNRLLFWVDRANTLNPQNSNTLSDEEESFLDAEYGIWVESITALGKLGTSKSFEPLVVTLQTQIYDDFLMVNTIYALGELKDKRVIPYLMALLTPTCDGSICSAAIITLGNLHATECLPILSLILTQNDDPEIHESVYYAQNKLNSKN